MKIRPYSPEQIAALAAQLPPLPAPAHDPSVNDELTAHLAHAYPAISIDELREMLRYGNPGASRDEWRGDIWGIRDLTNGSEEGLALATAYSYGDLHGYLEPKFVSEDDVRKVWDSDKPEREHRIGGGSLIAKLRRRMREAESSLSLPIDPTQLVQLPTGDTTNSELFAAAAQSRLKYNTTRNKWLVCIDGVWILCERGEPMAFAKQVAKAIHDKVLDAAKTLGMDHPAVQRWMKEVKRLLNLPAQQAMQELAKAEPGMCVVQGDFDRHPTLLCVRNGVVDLERLVLLPHAPDGLHSRQVNASFDPTATCPLFEHFLRTIFQGSDAMIDSVQRACGYFLIGEITVERVFFGYGGGANGKSVLANLLFNILGGYCAVAPATLLDVQHNGSGARSDIAVLAGARLVLVNETDEHKRLDARLLKILGSTEPITARYLYGEYFTFIPTAKVLLRGNHKPKISDVSDGVWRRLDLWPFDHQIPEDQRDAHLLTKLLAERDGILMWMLEGCRKFLDSGLTRAPEIVEASLSYRAESDVFQQWLDECCIFDPAAKTVTAELYASYEQWCKDGHLTPVSRNCFTPKLTTRGYLTAPTSGARKTSGLALREPIISTDSTMLGAFS